MQALEKMLFLVNQLGLVLCVTRTNRARRPGKLNNSLDRYREASAWLLRLVFAIAFSEKRGGCGLADVCSFSPGFWTEARADVPSCDLPGVWGGGWGTPGTAQLAAPACVPLRAGAASAGCFFEGAVG